MAVWFDSAPFVGRERELRACEGQLAIARTGQIRVIALAGEPGIGKTRTAEAAAQLCRNRGARVLWGRCFDDEWSPAYAPWLDVLGGLLLGEGRTALSEQDRLVLARLVPDLAETDAAPELGPEQERLRLWSAIARLIAVAAQREPLVVVLDDLHWADDASLGLLLHSARLLSSTPVLFVVTHRDVELTHPLEQSLAELRRLQVLERLTLVPFTAGETHGLVEVLAGPAIASALGTAIHERAGGIPFFVDEVLRHVAAAPTVPSSLEAIGVPPTVRGAIALRLRRLSEDAVTVLHVASAFAVEFDARVLRELTGLPEARVLDVLDETTREAMIRTTAPSGQTFEFAHALVRDVLYEELSPSRRARLHRRVAHALERAHAGHELEHAAELAYQYHRSAALPGAAHGLRFALAAADQARLASAPPQEARFLRMALGLAVDATVPARTSIVRSLVRAETAALEVAAAEATVRAALEELNSAAAPPDHVADFLADATWALKQAGADDGALIPLVELGLSLLDGRHDLCWARLKLTIGGVERLELNGLRYGRWVGFDPEAVAIARREGTEDDYARTLEPMEWRTAAEIDALRARVRRWRSPAARIRGMEVVARSYLYRTHDVRVGAAVCAELYDESLRVGSITGQATALVLSALAQLDLGEIESGRRAIDEAAELVAALGPAHPLHNFLEAAEELLVTLVGGDWAAVAESKLAALDDSTYRWPWMHLSDTARAVRAYGELGRRAEAVHLLELVTPALEGQDPRHTAALVQLRDASTAVWLLELGEWAPRYLDLALRMIESGASDLAEQPAGRMAALLGLLDEAHAHFERARAAAERRGLRPRRALVDIDEGVALVRAGRPGAAELIAAARAEFESMGMTAWVSRADELAEQRASSRRDDLTPREAEVLGLLAEGLTNKQIAGRLVLSVHTVERHVANGYRKIGARNRANATAYALRSGL